MDHLIYERAFLIRAFEERLLELFGQGRLAGTVHTSIGQELGAVAVAQELREADWVFSNHRCHGHYLALRPNVRGLLAEVMGHPSGICAGRGGSQHICEGRFLSNGIQGGGIPIAAGCGLAESLKHGSESIAVAFIGDGTLGQGVLYETLNLASLWSVPLLIILEHNGYAQSTATATTTAGDIEQRFQAFGLRTWSADIWHGEHLLDASRDCVRFVRAERKPAVLVIASYRLRAHSKGDDNRDPAEVARFFEQDPIQLFTNREPEMARILAARAGSVLDQALATIEALPSEGTSASPAPALNKAPLDAPGRPPPPFRKTWQSVPSHSGTPRLSEGLNAGLAALLQQDPSVILLGEDVEDPYGGAFKVTKGLSSRFPGRVRNTPISEAALAGCGNGLAIAGMRPIVEIMFGDFVTLIADQVINQSSKFAYLYNDQVRVPVIYRTPMGGRRGYGATHSQSLERHFFGVPGLTIIAVNDVVAPEAILRHIHESVPGPCLLVENKLLYSARLRSTSFRGLAWLDDGAPFPTLRLPVGGGQDVTVVAYGGMLTHAEQAAEFLFSEDEIRCDLIVPTSLQPLDHLPIIESVRRTGRLVVVEEGQGFAGLGAEILARCSEILRGVPYRAARCFAAEHPIPCSRSQEAETLPQSADIVDAVRETLAS